MMPIEQYVNNFQESRNNISSQSQRLESNIQNTNSFSNQMETEFKNPVYKPPDFSNSMQDKGYSKIFSSSLSIQNHTRQTSGLPIPEDPKKRTFSFHEEVVPTRTISQDCQSAEFGQKASSTIQFGRTLKLQLQKYQEEDRLLGNQPISEAISKRDESSTYNAVNQFDFFPYKIARQIKNYIACSLI